MILMKFSDIKLPFINAPVLEEELFRKAWTILNFFGESFDASIARHQETDGGEDFESVQTDYVPFLDGHSICLDQFPLVCGEPLTDIGYVALHLAGGDEHLLEKDQIFFRSSLVPGGPRVFSGYSFDDPIESLESLINVGAILSAVEKSYWDNEYADPASRLNNLPESDTMRGMRVLLSNEDDE